MYMEMYLDMFMVFQFVMNLLVLGLVNEMMKQKCNRLRRTCGALAGSVLSVIPFFFPVNLYVRVAASFVLSLCSMVGTSVRIYSADSFLLAVKKVIVSTLLLGGLMSVVIRILKKTFMGEEGLITVLLTGGVSYFMLRIIVKHYSEADNYCKVTLFGEETLVVEALIDTGNTLTEPISGKPVSVLDKSVFESLFHQKPQLCRAIPYHSVGRKNGIIMGFLVKRIMVETKEGKKECEEVYVGVSDDFLTETDTYKMILHPSILE